MEWIPLESLIDGYGAAHCMTQVLQREAWDPSQPTAVRAISRPADINQSAYRLDGSPATNTTRGLIIEVNKKVIRK